MRNKWETYVIIFISFPLSSNTLYFLLFSLPTIHQFSLFSLSLPLSTFFSPLFCLPHLCQFFPKFSFSPSSSFSISCFSSVTPFLVVSCFKCCYFFYSVNTCCRLYVDKYRLGFWLFWGFNSRFKALRQCVLLSPGLKFGMGPT